MTPHGYDGGSRAQLRRTVHHHETTMGRKDTPPGNNNNRCTKESQHAYVQQLFTFFIHIRLDCTVRTYNNFIIIYCNSILNLLTLVRCKTVQ